MDGKRNTSCLSTEVSIRPGNSGMNILNGELSVNDFPALTKALSLNLQPIIHI